MLCHATVQNLKPSSPMPKQISRLLKRYAVSVQFAPSVYQVRSHARNLVAFGAASYLKKALLSKQSAKLGDHELRPKNLKRSDQVAFLIGAILAVIAIKTEPDGNLLVTTVCFLIGGTSSLLAWKVLNKFTK
jgi:hypothetical protein